MCLCLWARPIPNAAARFPQIFRSLTFHFNGVIPRTLKHPSHSIEWRMVEAHGATCAAELEPARVTHLIYRPGYERSEKVRSCITKHGIPCMPVNCVLDSMLQSRALHESLYRLGEVPPHANGIGPGSLLPHHQHPYFVANHGWFELRELSGGSSAASGSSAAVGGGEMTGAHSSFAGSFGKAATGGAPRFGPKGVGEAPPQISAINISEVSLRTSRQKSWPPAGAHNRFLFSNMTFTFAQGKLDLDGNPDHAAMAQCVTSRGAAALDGLSPATTHLIFASDDKKSNAMVAAVAAMDSLREGGARSGPPTCNAALVLASLAWVQDCVWLGEVLPVLGEYGASDKLLATLRKRRLRSGEPAAVDGAA